MLHILLLILKIIGIIIAVILGILVLTVCVVLFVPIRYQMSASCGGTLEGIHAKARVTWLLHLIRLNISYEDRKLSWRIGLAWKSIQSGKEDKNTIKAEVKTYGKEVEELWEDLEDDLEEEPGKDRKEEREASEVDEEEPVERSDKGCDEKEERSVRALEEECNRLMEGHHGEAGQEEEPGEAVEKSAEEPEELLARLEQEVERLLETEELLEEREAGVHKVWEEACEDNPEDQEEPEALCESGEKGEREACEDNGKEERKACEDSGKGERKACEDSSKEPGLAVKSGADRDEDSAECREEYEESGQDGDRGWKRIWRKLVDGCRQFIRKISSLYQRIMGIPGRIKCTIQKICGKIGTLSGKKDKILDFLTDEVHRTAFVKVKDEVFGLLLKLRPKKLLGRIRYGFEDPCLTGKLLAGFSIAYPFLGDHLKICPDFERRILKGSFEASGRLRVSYFVKLVLSLVWCREVRMTYRHVRKFEL